MALGGIGCALLCAVLVGVCASQVGAFERAPVRPGHTVRAEPLGAHERWVGVHELSVRGQLQLPRPPSKPSPAPPRLVPRPALALTPGVARLARSHSRLSRHLPEGQGRLADRPVVANCPAQGPPRAA